MSIVRKLWVVVMLCLAGMAGAADLPAVFPQVRSIFPEADTYGGFEGTPPSVAVYQGGKRIGYIFLTEDVLTAATTFPKDRDKLDVPASTLMDPRILRYAQSEWSLY